MFDEVYRRRTQALARSATQQEVYTHPRRGRHKRMRERRRLPWEWVRARRGHEALRDPVVDVVEPGEDPAGIELDGCLQ